MNGATSDVVTIGRVTQTVGDLLASLKRVVPFDKAAGWDPVGLQLGDPGAPVAKVAVCHELTEGVVAALESDPVDLAVAYHPLLFGDVATFVAGRRPEGRAFRLVRAGVAVAVVHTAFDVAPGGAADALAASLSLEEVTGFGPLWPADSCAVTVIVPVPAASAVEAAMTDAGATPAAPFGIAPVAAAGGGDEPTVNVEMLVEAPAVDRVVTAMAAAHPDADPAYRVVDVKPSASFVGRCGSLGAPATLGDLAAVVADRIGGAIRVAGDPTDVVTTIAVVPGSGSSLISQVPPGVDVLVTGDVIHHRARAALDRGLRIIDPGHVETERPGIAALYAAICEMHDDVVDLTGIEVTPWRQA